MSKRQTQMAINKSTLTTTGTVSQLLPNKALNSPSDYIQSPSFSSRKKNLHVGTSRNELVNQTTVAQKTASQRRNFEFQATGLSLPSEESEDDNLPTEAEVAALKMSVKADSVSGLVPDFLDNHKIGIYPVHQRMSGP